MKILAVDDDPIILDLLRNSLSAQGHEDLTCAESAEEALEMIHRADKPFETFLLDILLPGSDGIDLCAEIRTIKAHRMTPIIMITASRQPNLMERAFAAGATDYVTKPFDGLELGTRVNLAAMLHDSVARERESAESLDEMAKLTQFGFEERLSLTGVPGMCDYLAIENHLLRSTSGCYAMSLFAVEIASARRIYNDVSAAEFRKQLELTAAAISECSNHENTQIAYAGMGLFVLVKHGRERLDLKVLCRSMQDVVKETWNPRETGSKTVSELRTLEISNNRLWSGMAASNAVAAFLEKRASRAMESRAEEEELFASMRKRMSLLN